MHYVKLHSAIWDNPKFLSLSSSEARLAYIRVLAAAKAADPEGQWPDRTYLDTSLRSDPWALAHVDELFDEDLLRTDDDGRVRVPQWSFWQSWEGKRPAAQLATEAPVLLGTRRAKDARRKRIRDWVAKGIERIDDCPEDIRDEVRRRLSGPNLRGVSADSRDHTDVPTDGGTTSETGVSAESSPAPAIAPQDISDDMSGEREGSCPWHGTAWVPSKYPGGRPFCPKQAAPHGPRNPRGYCAAQPEGPAPAVDIHADTSSYSDEACADCDGLVRATDAASWVLSGAHHGRVYCDRCAGLAHRPSWLARRGPCTRCDDPLDAFDVVLDPGTGGYGMHRHHADDGLPF